MRSLEVLCIHIFSVQSTVPTLCLKMPLKMGMEKLNRRKCDASLLRTFFSQQIKPHLKPKYIHLAVISVEFVKSTKATNAALFR